MLYIYIVASLLMASEILGNLQLGSMILNASKINALAANTGALISAPSVTITDAVTAASGILAQFNAHYLAAPTLVAANTGVTTTSANTLTIGGAPVGGTNETITNSFALNVLGGATSLAGNVVVGGTINASSMSGLTTLNGNTTKISTAIYYYNGTAAMSASAPSGGNGSTFASQVFNTIKAGQGTIASSFTLSTTSPLVFTATIKAKYTLSFAGQFSSGTTGNYLIYIAPVTSSYVPNGAASSGNYYLPGTTNFTVATANQAIPTSTTLTLPMAVGDSFTLSASSGSISAAVFSLSVVAEAALL